MRSRLGSHAVALVIVVAGALTLAGGCGGDNGDKGGATVPRATTTSSLSPSTTTAEQAFAIPDTIDADYVNRVMAALNKVYGDVVRKKVAQGGFREADLVPLRAIFNDPELEQTAYAIGRSPVGDRERYLDPIGDRRIVVVRILTARADCIAFEANYDFSAVVRDAVPGHGWLTLRQSQAGTDPANLNPTPWSIAVEDLDQETDGCAG